MKECCENCRFLFPQTHGDPVCRRYPPQLIMALGQVKNALGRMEEKPMLQSSLPPVPLDFWCGEYDEKKVILVIRNEQPQGIVA